MNKEELVRAISRETGQVVSQEKIALVLSKAVEIMSRTLDSGESVKWSGFGSLIPKERPPRKIYSPRGKDFIVTEGKRSIVFRESGAAKKR